MGALIVVEVYSICNSNLDLFDIPKAHILKQLVLHRIVYSLSLSIIFRISTLRHADSDMIVIQQLDIIITCILTTTVRVMYKIMTFYSFNAFESHLKCFKRIYRFQSRTDAPSNYFFSIGIQDQG